MKYGIQFGIEKWNMMDFSGKTMKEVKDNLENFFYTYNIPYEYKGDYYYEFTLRDRDGKMKHLAHIGILD